jgi:putative ATPase
MSPRAEYTGRYDPGVIDEPAQPGLFANDARARAPLAARMRPRTVEEVIGQSHVIGPGKALRRAIESGTTGSLVLWGPPGSGKTTLAYVIARMAQAAVFTLSGVTDGVAELRQVIAQARKSTRRTLLIVDEIHRWSRSQQAALLPHVEEGLVTLIGVTSENPYFDIIPPLRSRLRIVRLEPLTADDVAAILLRAIADAERGLGAMSLEVDDEAVRALVETTGGDARMALNVLEAAVSAAEADAGSLTAERVWTALQQRQVRYDRDADDHYNTISAFIKSVRGSDPDAAVFWLAKMIIAGEDVRFITRRMLILASEDIGNADPQALVVASAAAQAVEMVGYPEAQLILAQAALYLAMAPKSNSATTAIGAARAAIERGANTEVPMHLRDAHYQGAKAQGFGAGYLYPHDYPGNWVEQQYLPDDVRPEFFQAGDNGWEAERPARERL